jgi:hypothetical protein
MTVMAGGYMSICWSISCCSARLVWQQQQQQQMGG